MLQSNGDGVAAVMVVAGEAQSSYLYILRDQIDWCMSVGV